MTAELRRRKIKSWMEEAKTFYLDPEAFIQEQIKQELLSEEGYKLWTCGYNQLLDQRSRDYAQNQ